MAASAIGPVRAQDSDDLKRAVARISLMDGQVSVKRGDSGDWVAGIINAPLITDDRIATGPNSRTEVQFDGSNLLRMGGNAEIHLADLEYGRYQIEFAKGTLTFRILKPSNINIEVDTPSVSVRPSQVGSYRISVNDAGETEVTARAGNVEVYTPRGSQSVNAGQTMMARGTQSDPEFQIVSAIPLDEWDRWNEDRDQLLERPSPSARYVDPNGAGVSGVEDLDNNGNWVSVPDYGTVWQPTAVPAGWAPYSNGRWVWLDWYGWTWVDYDPWGWAPFHYGRWLWGGGYGWCWYPGAWGARPFWSPALVGWFGFGGGAGFGFGFGNIGWAALAPYEAFHPWWGRGFYGQAAFNRNINISSVNITNVYRNARIQGGAMGVAAEDFRSGRFTSVSRVSTAQLRSAGAIRGQVPIAPTAANLRYSSRQAGFTPQANGNTRFFSHSQASPPQRIPFAQQQRAFGSAEGRVAPQSQSAMRPAAGGGERGGLTPSVRQPGAATNSTRPGVSPGASSGWRRFGEPNSAAGSAQGSVRNEASGSRSNLENTRPGQAESNRGWQRFGSPGGSQSASPRYNAPSTSAPRYSAPRNSEPQRGYSSPAPSYSAPRGGGGNRPSYSAPRGGGGGGRPSGGGGGRRR
jgi:hypothetical protein